jgi:hypothetical protein
MVDVDESAANGVVDEVCTDVNVLHAQVGLWVMGAHNCPLVVTVKGGRVVLWEAQFLEERA